MGSISSWWCFGPGRRRPECNWGVVPRHSGSEFDSIRNTVLPGQFPPQDDNAPVHLTRFVRDFLEHEQIHTLYQPPLSPDCNPIEHLWEAL